MAYSIAIDGPAGAGKSTVAKKLAKMKGFVYLDTGAMYRACALKSIRMNLDISDTEGIEDMLSDISIDFTYENDGRMRVFLDGEDVTGLIRTPEISIKASDISAIPAVRYKMVELQREMAKERDTVLDGRDIGTFVLPDADLKIFLTASSLERARRRFEEMQERGDKSSTLEEVQKDIERRDYNDSHRELAPLKKAEDAIVIDSTYMKIDEVVDKILEYM